MNKDLKKSPYENEKEYCIRICSLKETYGFSWKEISELLNSELNYNFSTDRYRKIYEKYKKGKDDYTSNEIDILDEKAFSVQKERIKLQEERTQINSLVRALAREETLKEIAIEVSKSISNDKLLPSPKKQKVIKNTTKGILVISDWHYGIDVDTYYNKYNPDIAKKRVRQLLDESINIIKLENISEVYIVNLGDMISGAIHLPLRINSRIDVITQTIEVSEILAEFISELSTYCICNYGDVTDNHSRLDPNKKESLQVESFTRIISWYLKERLKNNKNVKFIENKFGADIYSFDVFDHKILAVHGDKDPQRKILTQLTTFTQEHFDLVLSAHRHHFFADEENETELYSNGSLMGADDFAASLRRNNKPSQLFIVANKDNISSKIYKIKLD